MSYRDLIREILYNITNLDMEAEINIWERESDSLMIEYKTKGPVQSVWGEEGIQVESSELVRKRAY